ncbi:hypothetical protein MDA_GLEAN10011981 [Myotis davidii]|uniref:Uncharacterized protein n=1 Tax=Myotis davidii TaxID=225400 RepID=L5MKI2_MYODS|nr:hypothetical protein MDA_GLEAN10011981 [Myotis davidii]
MTITGAILRPRTPQGHTPSSATCKSDKRNTSSSTTRRESRVSGGTGAHALATKHRLQHSSLRAESGPARMTDAAARAAQEELLTAQRLQEGEAVRAPTLSDADTARRRPV